MGDIVFDAAIERSQVRRELLQASPNLTRSVGTLVESSLRGEIRTPDRQELFRSDFGERHSSKKDSRRYKSRTDAFGPWMDDGKPAIRERLEKQPRPRTDLVGDL